ncbi:hypothetical protein KAZ66_05920 [Candidatus Woesebacteria bacterium]|nr:hypothetical protein [Candidatus Woesebacteria bacterium]
MPYLENFLSREYNRREVLLASSLALSAYVMGSATTENNVDRREGLVPLFNAVNFDFVSPGAAPGKVSYNYLNTFAEIKELLGPDYNIPLKQLLFQFGPEVMQKKLEDVMKQDIGVQYPEYGMVAGGMLAFATHGWRVAETQKIFAKKYEYDFIPQVYPVQAGITIKDLHATDNLGNPSVLLHMSAEPVKEQLRLLPDMRIVNISLQFGTLAISHIRKKIRPVLDTPAYQTLQHALLSSVETSRPHEFIFFDPDKYFVDTSGADDIIKSLATGEAMDQDSGVYDVVSEEQIEVYRTETMRNILQRTFSLEEVNTSSRPYYEITGAFRDMATGLANIQELFSLVYEFPEKLFIVAAGNYGDDLDPLREQYADEWPQNLIIAGHWDNATQKPCMYDTYYNYGADIYFDAGSIGVEYGSSMAAATFSSGASILESQGYTNREIKQILYDCCEDVTIEKTPPVPVGSSDIEDYINAQMNKTNVTVRVFNPHIFQEKITRAQI